MLPRLPHTAETREKQRRAATGKRHTDIARLKIGLARLGKKHSPATIEKIRAARRARPPAETPERVLLRKRGERRADVREAKRQWKIDVRVAYYLGDPLLLEDVVRSKGYWGSRKVHHPSVSDGWHRERGVVWGFPRKLEERVRIGLIKGFVRTNAKRAREHGLKEAG